MKNSPKYKHARIGTINALARTLQVDCSMLGRIADNAKNLYRVAKEIKKEDGTIRRTYDALKPLKRIQARIKKEILDHVEFPEYLTGSLKGRDYKTNAALHCGAKIVITEDISGFFPSTTSSHVFNVWHKFFRFSEEVAACLTVLTTKDGELPQGASTSAHLANLVFWRTEPKLQASFAARGIVYSRYVDDMGVSSKTQIPPEEKTRIISVVYGMLYRYGYHPKRSKHELRTAKDRMTMTKLGVNKKPSLSHQEQSNIRAAVHGIGQAVASGNKNPMLAATFRKVKGRVSKLGRFHSGKATKLKVQLASIQSVMESDVPR